MGSPGRMTLANRIRANAASVRPWQRSLKSCVSEIFDTIEALPRTRGYIGYVAEQIDAHFELEFRLDMAATRQSAEAALLRNPHDASALALLSWVGQLEANPPLEPVKLGTLSETIFRERRDRKKAGTYVQPADTRRALVDALQTREPSSPEAAPPPLRQTDIQNVSPVPRAMSVSDPADQTEPVSPGPAGGEHASVTISNGRSAVTPSHTPDCTTSGDEVDPSYSLLNLGRGFDVERIDEKRPVRPRKLS